MTTLNERVYWNTHTYGQVRIIKRCYILAALILLCVVTPATNWAIPILPKIVKGDMRI